MCIRRLLTEHANAMEWHDARWWYFILLRFRRIGEFVLYFGGNLYIAGKAQHHLIQNVFENEVLVIVGGCQLDIFEYQLIHNQIHIDHIRLEKFPMVNVL